jgi:hypothetical protein
MGVGRDGMLWLLRWFRFLLFNLFGAGAGALKAAGGVPTEAADDVV